MLRKKIMISAVIILSLILINLSLSFAGPIMEFKDTSHSFGLIEQNTQHKHLFTFTNTGDEDLEIIEVKPSCGCTAALLQDKIIPPGKTGEIEVTFNSGKFKGDIKKTVSIETNEEPRTRLIKEPGIGPRLSREIKEPAMIRKLFINAEVKYDKEKDTALKRAREAAMRKSKAARTQTDKMAVTPIPPSVPLKIEFTPRNIALGEILTNKDYKTNVKLFASEKEKYVIDRVAVSAPFTSAMITKLEISENNPGEVQVVVNAKSQGEMRDGKVMVYFVGSSVPVTVPITWSTSNKK